MQGSVLRLNLGMAMLCSQEFVLYCYSQPLKEEFEVRTINTAEHPPIKWKRYHDDTFVITKMSHKAVCYLVVILVVILP